MAHDPSSLEVTVGKMASPVYLCETCNAQRYLLQMCTIHLIDDEKGVKQYVLQTFFISRDNHTVSIRISDFNNIFQMSPGWLFIFPGRLFTVPEKPIRSAFFFNYYFQAMTFFTTLSNNNDAPLTRNF